MGQREEAHLAGDDRHRRSPYKGEMKPKLFVKKADVAAKLGIALIVDVREAPFFKERKSSISSRRPAGSKAP